MKRIFLTIALLLGNVAFGAFSFFAPLAYLIALSIAGFAFVAYCMWYVAGELLRGKR